MTFGIALILLKLTLDPAMTHDAQALELKVTDMGPHLEVQLLAHSLRAQQVSYEFEVTGNSISRHRGKTSLAAGSEHVLSTVKASKDENWCARVTVEEENRDPYELREGNCA